MRMSYDDRYQPIGLISGDYLAAIESQEIEATDEVFSTANEAAAFAMGFDIGQGDHA